MTMSLRRYWFLAFTFLFLAILFYFRTIAVPDPDFGWHIQMGNYILSNGIPQTDPFSYSMPSYAYPDHEWLLNILWAVTYNSFGEVPLILGSILLVVGSLVLQTITLNKRWVSLLIFLVGGTMLEFMGVRAQLITWFFLSLLCCLLFEKKLWLRWRFFLPVLFLLWANLHGGFGVGLVVLGIVILGRGLEGKKLDKADTLLFILCILVTLINPFGVRLWGEFWTTLSDSQLRWSIAEWYPALYFTNIAFWIYFSLSTYLLIKYRKHYSRTELFLYIIILIAGLLSMRNIPLWVIVSFSFTARGIELLSKDAAKHKYGKHRFEIAYKAFFVLAIGCFLPQIVAFFYGAFVLQQNKQSYPEQAVVYLKEHLPKEQLFSTYNWGGYLLWQLPEKKVFIDGRMPSWRWEANKPGESNYAFDEYKQVMTGKIDFVSFTKKYHIETLLVPKDELYPPSMKLFGYTIEKNSFLRKFFFSEFSFAGVVIQAKKAGWKETYRDETAVIFEKPKR